MSYFYEINIFTRRRHAQYEYLRNSTFSGNYLTWVFIETSLLRASCLYPLKMAQKKKSKMFMSCIATWAPARCRFLTETNPVEILYLIFNIGAEELCNKFWHFAGEILFGIHPFSMVTFQLIMTFADIFLNLQRLLKEVV